MPPLSPVAWSSFLTGSNPGKHNIYDFLSRDRRTYLPTLSSVSIRGSRRSLRLGPYEIPIGKPEHLEYRKRITADEMIGPTLHVGSPQLAGQAFGAVFNGREVTTAEEARQAVRDFYSEATTSSS